MNILFLTTSFPEFDGDSHGTWVRVMADELSKNHFVHIIAPSSPKSLPSKNEKVIVDRFRYFFKKFEKIAYGPGIMNNLKKYPLLYILMPFFIVSFISKTLKNIKKSDIIHGHFVIAGLIAYIANNISGSSKKIITSFYGNDVSHCKKYYRLYKSFLISCYRFIAISEDMKQRLMTELNIPEEKIIVHYLGIDTKNFAEKKIFTNKITAFLTVARFVEKKGIEYSIRACAILKEKYENFHYYIIGDGPLLPNYINLISDLNLNDKITIINNYNYKDPRAVVKEYFLLADIFVLSSVSDINDYGGTPIVLTEAQAMAIPCIASNDSGNKDVVLDSITGCIVLEKNPNAIADTMYYLVTNQEKAREYGFNGRNHIVKNFDSVLQTKKLVQIYENGECDD